MAEFDSLVAIVTGGASGIGAAVARRLANAREHPAEHDRIEGLEHLDKVIDIDSCYLMDPVNNRIRNKIREWATERAFTFYDIKAHTGWLRNLFIRYTTTGELMVNLCIQHEDEANRTWLLDQLLKEIPEMKEELRRPMMLLISVLK